MSQPQIVIVNEALATKMLEFFRGQITKTSNDDESTGKGPAVGSSCPQCRKGVVMKSRYKDNQFFCSNYRDDGCKWRLNA